MAEVIRPCPHCKQPMTINTGLNAQNFKNLFRMPTLDEWITLFIIIMTLVSAYAYIHDTKACKETLANIGLVCKQINDAPRGNYSSIILPSGINFSIVENNLGT